MASRSAAPTPLRRTSQLLLGLILALAALSGLAAPARAGGATPLADGTVGVALAVDLPGSYGFDSPLLSEGQSLPPGTHIASNDDHTASALVGTPTDAGDYTFGVGVIGILDGTYSIHIGVAAPTATQLDPGTVGHDYRNDLVGTLGDDVVIPESYDTGVPAGMSVVNNGDNPDLSDLVGSPTEGGTFTFSTGPEGGAANHRWTLTVSTPPTVTVSPATLDGATVGTAYSETLSGGGGTSPYSLALTAGALPTGLSLNAATGVLSGTPTAGGTFNFTVTATDDSDYTGSRAYSLTVAAPTVSVTAPSLSLVAGNAVSSGTSFSASGGTSTYGFAVTAGTLPDGLSLSGAGALTGTPTAPGAFSFTVTATDSSTGTGPYTGSTVVTGTVNGVGPADLGTFYFTHARTVSLTAAGGTAPYAWSLPGNSKPWITIDGTTGALTITAPKGVANPTFQVLALSTDHVALTRVYTATLSGRVEPVTLPAGQVGIAYDQPITASAGTAPWTVTSTGTLPAGLTIDHGTLHGVPTTAGTSTFSLTVVTGDETPLTFTNSYSVTVAARALPYNSLRSGTVGFPYSENVIPAGDDPAGAYTYELLAGVLPTGLSLGVNSASGFPGLVHGTPGAPGTYRFTVKATLISDPTLTATNVYDVTIKKPTITVTASVGTLKAGVAMTSSQPSASGGLSPYTFSVTGLPDGLSYDSTTNTISGTPTERGAYSVTVTATDSETGSGAATGTTTLTGTVADPTLTLTNTTLDDATAGVSYGPVTFTAGGGTAPYSLRSSTVPAGLSLVDNEDGTFTLSGTPTETGTKTLSIEVEDSTTGGEFYSQTFSPTLGIGAPTITGDNTSDNAVDLGSIQAGVKEKDLDLTPVSGGTAPYTYTVADETFLPAGLSLDTLDGTPYLSGTPTQVGTFAIVIHAVDSTTGGTYAVDTHYTLTVTPPTIVLPDTDLGSATDGVSYGPVDLEPATGGTADYTYSVECSAPGNEILLQESSVHANVVPCANTLPAGLSLSSDGTLSGTPTTAGTFTFTVTATDSTLPPTGDTTTYTGTHEFTLVIDAPTVTLATATLDGQTEHSAASIELPQAAGGTGPYTYAVTGLTDASVTTDLDGVPTLSWTPTSKGTFTFGVTATDSSTGTQYSSTATQFSVDVTSDLDLTTESLAADTVGQPYSQSLLATGGTEFAGVPILVSFPTNEADCTAAHGHWIVTIIGFCIGADPIISDPEPVASYHFALVTGDLPDGLTLDQDGTISGTPTTTGTFTGTYSVTDAEGTTVSKSLDITIREALVIGPDALLDPTVGVAYSDRVVTHKGIGAYTYDITGLPAGLSYDASTGVISGTPTTLSSSASMVTVHVVDSATDGSGPGGADEVTRTYSMTVQPPTLTVSPSTMPAGQVGVPYAQAVTTGGGLAPRTATLTDDNTFGLSYANGTISGTPTRFGTITLHLAVTDSSLGSDTTDGHATQTFALPIDVSAPTLTVSPTAYTGTNGVPFSQQLTGSGGAGAYTFSLPDGADTDGLSLSSTGLLSGTPTADGTYHFSVQVADAALGVDDSAETPTTIPVTLTVGVAAITITPSTLIAPTDGIAYSQQLHAAGGIGTLSFAVTAGALPDGLTLNTSGLISGTPTRAGVFEFSVSATDDGSEVTGTQAYVVTVLAPRVVVTPTTDKAGTVGHPFSDRFFASGGTGPWTFSATGLPAGLSIDASTGLVTGIPTAGGSFDVLVSARDSSGAPSVGLLVDLATVWANGYTGAAHVTFTVAAPTVAVAPATLPHGTDGVAYAATVSASGGTGPWTYALGDGAPSWLHLDPATGALSGTPTGDGSWAVTVLATDSSTGTGPFTGSRDYTLVVGTPTLVLTPDDLSDGTAGVAYDQALSVSGGTGDYTLSATGLPAGLSLTGGHVTGTPSAGGTFKVVVTVTDSSNGTSGAQTLTARYALVVAKATVTVTPGTLPAATVGSAYSQALASAGGTAPRTLAVTAGALPAGVTFDGTTLSGTPTASGTFGFSVTATDSSTGTGPYSTTKAYSLVVGAPTVTLAASLPGGTAGTAYSKTLAASGGTAPYSYAVTSGSLPAGLSLTSGGVLSGTLGGAGTATFTVTATDSTGGTGPFTAHSSWTVTVAKGALHHLVITRTSAAAPLIGQAETFKAEGFDVAGDDLGDVTAETVFSIAPDGTCSAASCTPATGGQHTVTGVDGTASGTLVEQTGATAPVLAHFAAKAGNTIATVTYGYTVSGPGPFAVTLTARDPQGHVQTVTGLPTEGTAVVRTLTNGTAWTLTLAITSASGNLSTPIAVVTPGATPKITLSVSSHGSKITYKGVLTANGNLLGGRIVTITTTVNGQTVTLAKARTGKRGTYSVTVTRPTWHGPKAVSAAAKVSTATAKTNRTVTF